MQAVTLFRAMGALLLPLCGWLAGNAVQAAAAQHTEALRQVLLLLRRIRQEVEFRRADFVQLYAGLQREGLLQRFCIVGGTLQSLAPPPELSAAERRCFAECMAGLGRTEAKQECERLEYYMTRFEEYLQLARQTQSREAALPCKLGLAAGAVLALAFL